MPFPCLGKGGGHGTDATLGFNYGDPVASRLLRR